MLDFNRILVNILQSGDASDPEFRARVYVRAEEAVVNIAKKQDNPEKHVEQWIPLLHKQIEIIENQYARPDEEAYIRDEVEQVVIQPDLTSADPEPAPSPLPPSAATEKIVTEKSAFGKILTGIIAGMTLGAAGVFLFIGNADQPTKNTMQIVDLSVGEQISSDATLKQVNNTLKISDNSKSVPQFRRWGARKIIAQVSHNLTIKVAASETATNSPRFLILFNGGKAKNVTYSFDMNLKAGTVKGTGLKDKASRTMLLKDGYWIFTRKLKPNPKHTNVFLNVYPAFKGAKTGSILLKKLDLSLE